MTATTETASQIAEPASAQAEAGVMICTGKLPLVPRHRRWRDRGLVEILEERQPVLRPARVAMTMALARELARKVCSGEFENQVELASLTDLTATRITQLMDLTFLAPDIRRDVLQLLSVNGREPISERKVRNLLRELTWDGQRERWRELRSSIR